MKKFWSYLLSLCMTATIFAGLAVPIQVVQAEEVTAVNLIQDPGLENTAELVKDGAPWDNNTGTAVIETDLQHVNSGSHAIRFEGQYAYVKQTDIPVEIGADYKLTVYTKVAVSKINILVQQGGSELKNSFTNTSYKQQTVNFTAITDKITVELYTSGGSTFAWADDFELVKLVQEGPADEEAPTAITDLEASNITDISADFSWGASTDNVGVTGYIIYENSTEKQTVAGTVTAATVTGLTPETQYTFTVKAKDAAGNLSVASNLVEVTTIQTPEAGEQPTSLVQDAGFETISAITPVSTPWYTDAAQANKAFSIVTDQKYAGNKALHFAEAWCWVEQRIAVEPNTLYSVSMRVKTEATEDGVFRFGIRDAVDSNRWVLHNEQNNINKSTNGWILMENTFVTGEADNEVRLAMFQRKAGKVWIDDVIIEKIEDVQPPTTPNNLIASDINNSSLRLSWDAATDDNGVASYEVYKDGELLNTAAANVTTLLVSGLARSTEYKFKVRAKDTAGKFSEFTDELPVSTTGEETRYFKVQGSKIFDPNGNEFVIKGANVMGYNAAWPVEALSQVDLFKTWGFNFARVYSRIDMTYKTGGVDGHNRDLNKFYEIIDAYTAEGIVVMIEVHDFTGAYYTDTTTPSLTELANFHASLAERYIDNPYVWFNVMNEPGGSGAASAQWVTTNQKVIKAIRDTGNNSIIVADGASWGQDVGEWNSNPVKEENSAILKYGADLKNFDGNTYENIMFSIHAYDQWRYGDAKLIDFIDRVQAKGHALMIGEFGSWNNSYGFESLDTVMRVAPEKGVGLVVWHWWGGDRNRLTVRVDGTNGGGQFINKTDGTKPTNLTYLGNLVWDYNHDQLTAQSFNNNLEKDPEAAIALPKPATKVVDDFEGYESDEALVATWIPPGHGGTVIASLNGDNKNKGSYSMKLDYTTSSTHAGRRKVINEDWSDYEGISFWVKPDGSGRRLVIQLAIGTISWEYDYILSGTEPELVKIPFTAFLHPNNMGGNPDVTKVSQLNIYINNNFRDASIPAIQRGSGILYFDDIILMDGQTEDEDDGSTGGGDTGNTGGTTTPDTAATTNTEPAVVISVISAVTSNGKVTVDVTANKSIVKEIFDAIKGTDKTVTFTQNGIEWSFNGKDITSSTKTIDMTVKVAKLDSTTSDNKVGIESKVKDKDIVVISFANNGQLPGKAKVKVKLDAAWLTGKNNLNIYYYNEVTQAMETIASGLAADAEGYVVFDITHNSDYIVTDQDLTVTTTTPVEPTTVRLGGANRYETSVKISQDGWTTSDNVVLARGDEFADALTAAPFAKQLNAPILLTSTNTIDASVAAELKRLKVKKVYVIGGTGAISTAVENAVKAMGSTVERISGSDRYATSLAIANRMANKSQVFLATGTSYADALSISSYAATTGSPILLTVKDQITAGVAKFIKDNNSKVYVIGGTGVISEAAVQGIAGAERISGTDRYATNLAVLNKFAVGYDFSKIYLATGANYPDAICGSALAGKDKAPIILVNSSDISNQKTYVNSVIEKVSNIKVLGGEGVLTPDSIKKLTSN